MTRVLGLLAILIFASAHAAAKPAPLPGVDGRVTLGAHVVVLEDAGGGLQLDDVRKPEHAARFAPAASAPLNFGYTRSAWWLRFALPGGAAAGEELLLEIAFPSIDRLEFYVPETQPGGERRYWARIAGDALPWDAREVRHRNHVFRFPAPATAGEHVYYLRAVSRGVLTVPLTLWRPASFAEHERDAQLILGLFYGLALALVLYNLMLFFAVRDRVYLYYVLYACAFGTFLFSFDGLAYQYLWPKSVWAANHVLALALSLTLLFGAQFARTFLDTRRIAPRADAAMLAVVAAGGALAVFSATGWVLDYGGVLTSSMGGAFAAFCVEHGVDAEVFQRVAEGAPLPIVEPPSAREFAAIYEEICGASGTILSIHLSSKLSRTIHNARAGADVAIEDSVFSLSPADTCCAPGYTPVALTNRSEREPAFVVVADARAGAGGVAHPGEELARGPGLVRSGGARHWLLVYGASRYALPWTSIDLRERVEPWSG